MPSKNINWNSMPRQPNVSDPLAMGNPADVTSELAAHWLAAGELPPELLTGHKLLDMEHRFLISAIANLRKVCRDQLNLKDCHACGHGQQKDCEGHVVGMLGDLFAFILEHFKTEELVMRKSLLLTVDREVCEAHKEDHAAISLKVQQIVSSLDTRDIVSRIRELDAVLVGWITHHIVLHDQILWRWVAREDSVLKGL